MLCGLSTTDVVPPLVNCMEPLYVPGNRELMFAFTVTFCSPPAVTVPDWGEAESQLEPSLVLLDELHCNGCTPGLLTVTV
jgi:hypothetical protein